MQSSEQEFAPSKIQTRLLPLEYIDMLEQYWPDCEELPDGSLKMAAGDAQQLEALFEAFGVPINVRDNSAKMLGKAYDTFSLGFVEFVKARMLNPEEFREKVHDWPEAWRDYVEAVAAQDRPLTRQLAMFLQPLAPDCILPPRLFDALYR